jgi:hypothetical protein
MCASHIVYVRLKICGRVARSSLFGHNSFFVVCFLLKANGLLIGVCVSTSFDLRLLVQVGVPHIETRR